MKPKTQAPHKSEWLDRIDKRGRRFKQKVTIGLRELTRDEANEWLLRVDDAHQRNLSDGPAERYCRDMNHEDDWIEGTNIMAFDLKGRLINGQHTLTAFVRSNLKKLLVVWGIYRHPREHDSGVLPALKVTRVARMSLAFFYTPNLLW